MAYDRYETRDAPRDERSRWSDDDSWRSDRDRTRSQDRDWRSSNPGRGDDRGFWDRASDEVASWFGDDDAERRRREDQMRDRREQGSSGRDRDYDRGYGRDFDRDRGRRSWLETKGENYRGGFSERDYNPHWRHELSGNHDFDRNRERGSDRNRSYRPMAGDYGRSDHESDQFFAASGYGRNDYGRERDFGRGRQSGQNREFGRDNDRSQSPWGRDEYRRTEYAGSGYSGWRERDVDPHYRSWRDRHMSDLDRDYDDYRRENASKFENDFGSWREQRMRKRELLGRIREHMEVVGSDDEHVGKVDKVAGDRIILTKSDPESGGVHHSLSCSDLDRIEGDKVILDCTADQARKRWRDESRSRALFEREDQGEAGPRALDRSFEGTYRDR
jgi:hypothetical protein